MPCIPKTVPIYSCRQICIHIISILISNSVNSLKEVSKYNHVHNCRLLQSFPKNTIANRNVIMLIEAYIAGDNYDGLAIYVRIWLLIHVIYKFYAYL